MRGDLLAFVGGFLKHGNNLDRCYIHPLVVHVDAYHNTLPVDFMRDFIGGQNPHDKVVLLLGHMSCPLIERANLAVFLRLRDRTKKKPNKIAAKNTVIFFMFVSLGDRTINVNLLLTLHRLFSICQMNFHDRTI